MKTILIKDLMQFFRGKKREKIDPATYKYPYILMDITNNCNLRCPFCLNDFRIKRTTTMMTEEVYKKVLLLLPLAEQEIFFSCLYEPTLHPNFIRFLQMIPRQFQKKVFFTTNLTTDISTETMKKLADLDLSFINISLDSLLPRTYENLRRGAKFIKFYKNLENLVSIFSAHSNSPPLRYITIALKPNFEEIPEIIEKCVREFKASLNEVRYVYELPHLNLEWKINHLLSNKEWSHLEEFVRNSSYNVKIEIPPTVYFPSDNVHYSKGCADDTPEVKKFLLDSLNITSEGNVYLHSQNKCYDLQKISKPFDFFNNLGKTLFRVTY